MADVTVTVREATEDDVPSIRDVFAAVYAGDYPYQNFFDLDWLKRSVFTDDIVMLVAEEETTGRVLGTASVVFDLGAHSDLLGEFGRLAVHPDARGRGVGNLLMAKRCEYIAPRLHVGIAQNRCVHPFSQQISKAHGFTAFGFLPMKYPFRHRESIAIWGRHFGNALALRRNHPRIVPEAHGLASVSLQGCGLQADAIVDVGAAPYPHDDGFELEVLTATGLPALLRIERGRVRQREVFGPARLHYGYFQLSVRHATYLIARHRQSGVIAGAVGYIHDPDAGTVQVFELIARDAPVVRPLLAALVASAQGELDAAYLEIDVSAYAPRLQRTLLELGFLPAAYVPAMVFHDVERLDVVKMVRLLVPLDLGEVSLVPETQVIADLVLRAFTKQQVVPRVADAISEVGLFDGLTGEQAMRVAGVCSVQQVASGERLFEAGDRADAIYLPLDAAVRVMHDGRAVGSVGRGEVVGETATVLGDAHTSTAVALGAGEVAVLSAADLTELSRMRPDIAVHLYRNLAVGLGHKLRRLDRTVVDDT